MIESLHLSNYKAFEDALIPIKPITIFLGANSVGKSSIIQMLMLLHQTAESMGGEYASALKIYGNYVNAGAYENLFPDKQINSPMRISIEIDSDDVISYVKQLKSDFISIFVQLAMYSNYCDVKDMSETARRLSNRAEFKDYLPKLNEYIKEQKDGTIRFFIRHLMGEFNGQKNSEVDSINIDEVIRAYEFLDDIVSEQSKTLFIVYELNASKDVLQIKSFEIQVEHSLLRIENNKATSEYLTLSHIESRAMMRCYNSGSTIFDCLVDRNIGKDKTSPVYLLGKVSYFILSELNKWCSGNMVNYVSPLRAHPKRYYMLDKANITLSLNTLDGDEVTEVLKENASIKKKVNVWFSKFGFKIDVSLFKEVIHNLMVTQNGLKLDITDVGFGISQVLPIIIQGFLSPANSITVVEQPEIHLHPTMQADLGDLFIDIVNNSHKKIIIETHSEYLLRRIRRRIAEGKISAEDVSICLFHPRSTDHPASVEVLKIGEKGGFQWPEDFYGGALYDDVTEFLKRQ